MPSIASWLRRARWTLTLPTVAVALTLFLLIIADRQEVEYYRTPRIRGVTNYVPPALSLIFFFNGPAFFPNPLPAPLKITFAERLYTLFIAWLGVGMYADWKSRHPSTLLIRNRTTRLVMFMVVSLSASVLAGLLLRDFWQEVTAYGFWHLWTQDENFQAGLFLLGIIFGWLLGLMAWSTINVVRSARMSHAGCTVDVNHVTTRNP